MSFQHYVYYLFSAIIYSLILNLEDEEGNKLIKEEVGKVETDEDEEEEEEEAEEEEEEDEEETGDAEEGSIMSINVHLIKI